MEKAINVTMEEKPGSDVQFLTHKSSKWLETLPASEEEDHGGEKQRIRVRVKKPQMSGQRSKKLIRVEESDFASQVTSVVRRRRRSTPVRSRSKKRRNIVVALCLLCTVVLPIIAYPVLATTYQRDLALAQAGAQKLQMGITLLQTLPQHPFDTQVVSDAQQNFADALTDFTPVNNSLALVPDQVRFVPVYGARLHGAKHLAALAVVAAEAGLAACAIVKTLAASFHNPLDTTSGAGLTMADMTILSQNVQQLKVLLDQAVVQVNQLGPAELQFDPRLGKLVGEFQTRLPLIQQIVNAAAVFFASTAPTVLGVDTPAYYLLEIADSTELRPGGGFIGNYGILTLSGGRVASTRVIDTYLLDQVYLKAGHVISWPEAYRWYPFRKHGWGLRDSNFDGDFPTSARNAEMLYKQEGGTLPVVGVIAITPAFISNIITLTGPIAVPEYHETVTAQNLIDRIHYHQLIEEGANPDTPSADGYSSQRKHFTALLGKYLLDRVRSLSGSLFPKLLQGVTDSLRTKDVQVYFNADPAEKLLQASHVDNSIQVPVGDGIFLVDANTAQNKSNKYIVTSMNDQVTVDTTGNATHHTVIKFNWTNTKLTGNPFFGPFRYRDYLRVYAPPNSSLQTFTGWGALQDSDILFGSKYWGGKLEVKYPVVGTITLTWSTPGAATHDAQGWHYRYLMQHQAGSQETVDIAVTFPACATIVAKSAGVVSGGNQQVHMAQPLSQDTNVSVDYTC